MRLLFVLPVVSTIITDWYTCHNSFLAVMHLVGSCRRVLIIECQKRPLVDFAEASWKQSRKWTPSGTKTLETLQPGEQENKSSPALWQTEPAWTTNLLAFNEGSRKRSPVFTVCCPSSYVVSVHQPYREVPWTTSANGLTAEMVMYWIPRHLKRPYSLRAAHSELWLYLVLVNHVAQNGSHSESFYSNNKAF